MGEVVRSLAFLSVYQTSRPWWRKRWQAEPSDNRIEWPEWRRAVTGWTIWDTAARAIERDYRARRRRLSDMDR